MSLDINYFEKTLLRFRKKFLHLLFENGILFTQCNQMPLLENNKNLE